MLIPRKIPSFGADANFNITLETQLAFAIINRSSGVQNGVDFWWRMNDTLSNSTSVAEIALSAYVSAKPS